MGVIFILISVSIFVAVIFLIAFVRAIRSGQYDDDYTPSVRMLFEDEVIKNNINPTPDSTKDESKINKE